MSSQKLASRIIRKTADDDCLPVLRRSIESSQPALKRLFTVDDMCLIQKDLDLSTRQTLVLAQELQAATNNRSIVQSSMKSKMRDKTHEIDSFFEYTTISFNRNVEIQDKKYSEHFEQHIIITNDIGSLIDKVILHRKLNNENVLVRVSLDGGWGAGRGGGGGGGVKICPSLFGIIKY